MLRVKICGLTRADDARLAAAAGADAIGLVFHEPSPRAVTADVAREIVKTLPPWVARVGVFVNADVDVIRHTVGTVGLTAVQLHGDETVEYVEQLDLRVPVIKAIAMRDGWERLARAFRHGPLLLDHADSVQPGGTGQAWDYARFSADLRPSWFILAGGLDATTVAGAVERLDPDAVDVSTGVESAPGVKSPAKIAAFMRAVAPFRAGGKGTS